MYADDDAKTCLHMPRYGKRFQKLGQTKRTRPSEPTGHTDRSHGQVTQTGHTDRSHGQVTQTGHTDRSHGQVTQTGHMNNC